MLRVINRVDLSITFLSGFLIILIGSLGWFSLGPPALIILVGISTAMVLATLIELYRRIHEQHIKNIRLHGRQKLQGLESYRQIESLFSVFSMINPRYPIPELRGWAASPDVLKTISEVVFTESPNIVDEASSGASTIIIGYCLKKLGKGKVFSLEHDPEYAEINKSLISSHGLDDIATIVYAPLVEISIDQKTWLWYDLAYLKLEMSIDVLVVDGPPGNTQELARYPALPLLYHSMSNSSKIILDDGKRPDEQMIVERWEEEFTDVDTKFINLEKGAYMIQIEKTGRSE